MPIFCRGSALKNHSSRPCTQAGAGTNKIPDAMAAWPAKRFGLAVESSIVQMNKVEQTGAIGWHRLASQALFDGHVESGRTCPLVDNFVGQGGTFANLRRHIIARGVSTGLPSQKLSTFCVSNLTPSEVEWLRRDKRQVNDLFAERAESDETLRRLIAASRVQA